MALRIIIELEEDDLGYFRNTITETRKKVESKAESEIFRKASAELNRAKKVKVPLFVEKRLNRLELLLNMLEDKDWDLTKQERADVFSALAYFVEPADLIHDSIPVLGFVDDAIMIELVARELQHELDAYRDFCTYKEEFRNLSQKSSRAPSKEAWLRSKRNQLHSRMRRRRSRMHKQVTRRSANRSRIRLF